jgi:hypothetical protein
MSLDLRPLTLGELLDRAFSLYRRHFWLFVGLLAIPSTITLLLVLVSQLATAFAPSFAGTAAGADRPDGMQLAAIIAVFGVGVVVLIIVYWIAYVVTLGAATIAISEIHVGRTATIASSYARMRGRVGRLLLLNLLIGLRLLGVFLAAMVIVGVLAFVIGLIARPLAFVVIFLGVFPAMVMPMVFVLRYAVSVPALMVEDVGAGEAIRRSVVLTRDNLGRTFVLILFTTMITYATMALFQGPFTVGAVMAGPESRAAFWFNLAGALTGAVAGAVTGPLMIIALALLYYDVRIRKEGLDLDVMIAGLDVPGTPSASSPVTSEG